MAASATCRTELLSETMRRFFAIGVTETGLVTAGALPLFGRGWHSESAQHTLPCVHAIVGKAMRSSEAKSRATLLRLPDTLPSNTNIACLLRPQAPLVMSSL